MADYKKGDIIRMKDSCSNSEEGKQYVLAIRGSDEELYAQNDPDYSRGCSCQHKWELVSSTPEKTMSNFTTLSELQKENLSEDSQALVRVRVLDGQLNVYDSSKLYNLLLKLNFKAIAKLAKEEIAAVEAEEAKAKEATK